MCTVLVTCSCISLIPLAAFKCFSISLVFSCLNMTFLYYFLYLSYLSLAELLESLCCYSSNTEIVQPIKKIFWPLFLFPHWDSNYIDIWPLTVSPQIPQAQLSFNMFFPLCLNLYNSIQSVYLQVFIYTCVSNLYKYYI